jgi:hypothetical protein
MFKKLLFQTYSKSNNDRISNNLSYIFSFIDDTSNRIIVPSPGGARGGSIYLTKKAALLIKLHGLPDFRNG